MDYLKTNALPRGTVPNNTWGYGFAQLPSLSPDPPTDVTAVAGDGQATVSWSAPAFDGGSIITSYTTTSDPGSITAVVDGSTLNSAVLGLTNSTTYTFTVTATNAVGTSEPSAPSNVVTPAVSPTPTPTPTLTPTPTPTPSPTPTPTPIPGVTPWGLGVLAVLMAVVVSWRVWRRTPDGSAERL